MQDKKILVVAPDSKHTKKFIDMVSEKYNVVSLSSTKIEGIQTIIVEKGILKKIMQLKKIIRDYQIDYIHLHNLSLLNIFYSFFLRNEKTIITTWGSDILIFPKKSILHKILVKLSLANFKTITTNDALSMQIILKEYTSKQIIPIHFGVNNFISFKEFKDKEKIIYSPRSHKDLYNIEIIIKSFANFIQDNQGWRLVLSGREDIVNTPRYKELCKKLNIYDNVEFVGFIDDKKNAEYYTKSMIVISIPSSDAKSVTVMEAISSNCLCIVSNLPSNKELIIDGVNGMIINENNIFDLNIFKKIDVNLMENVNRIISKQFSYENAKKRFLSLYEKE